MPYKISEVSKGDLPWTVDLIIAGWMVLMGQRGKHWLNYRRDWPGLLLSKIN